MTHLTPIARPYYLTQIFAVNASLGVKSFAELATLVKSKPGTFNYMAPSVSKVAFMEGFNKKNGTDIVRVPFKGGGDAVTSMLNGTTQIAIFGIGNLISFIQAGKIVGLAIDGDTRSPLAPDIPTFKEVGYTEHISPTFFGIYAPEGTPKPIIDKLNKAIVAVGIEAGLPAEIPDQPGLTPVAGIGGAIRQGTTGRPRRRPRRDQGLGALSECEVNFRTNRPGDTEAVIVDPEVGSAKEASRGANVAMGERQTPRRGEHGCLKRRSSKPIHPPVRPS